MSNKIETFGKYILLEKLATGGMAEVFLARGSGAGGIAKFFAIKRILPQFSDSPEFVDMFKDEAKIAINLNHSNIVSIHEFDIKNNQFFLVMDYVEGRNLRQILNKMKKGGMQFSIDQIIFMVREVAAGLDHAHRCLDGTTGKPLNITHRDMSPQNIMVSFDGEVKVVDFGIAKAESQIETTRAGTLKGKFGYMSPEQAEGQAVDLRTDIFSLGIVLWELLANDRLFVGNNEINTLRKIRDCQIPSLRKINPNIHSELERIVMKALARDRNLRYQTCAALHRDLNRFLNRQYPDFAPQDFAVFIKSVFADEILSVRKRLVEFAKVNVDSSRLSPQGEPELPAQNWAPEKSQQGQRNLLNTQTNSLVNHTASIPSQSMTPKPMLTEVTPIKEGTATTAATVPNVANASTATTPSALVLDLPAPKEMIHPTEPKYTSPANPPVPTLEIPEITSPSISRNSQVSRFTRSAPTQKRRAPVVSMSGMMFTILLISGLYVALVKTVPNSMIQVIAVTDKFMRPVNRAIGIQSTTESASVAPSQPHHSEPLPTPAQPLPAPVEVASQLPPPPPQDVIATTGPIVITSNPSGGEIYIDDKKSGLVTPSRMQVPHDRAFKLAIRKKGYLEYVRGSVKREELGNKLNANLIKSAMGYLDIDVIPPRNATIYLNGVAITDEQLPLRNYAVAAGTELKLRAQDSNDTSSEEVIVTVPTNGRRHIQLFLKKKH